jgi:hypothetical protein
MDRAKAFRKAKPCQRQRGCQHQNREHGTTERAHGDADRPIAEAKSQSRGCLTPALVDGRWLVRISIGAPAQSETT